ncbi:MAG: sialate O-acetylesterase, partial [Anaerolineales bacterium]
MVLQRDVKLKFWGWADPEEEVTLILAGQNESTRPNENGEWLIWIDPLEAGGPYEISIEGENSITIKNVLIGDVWFCSGQSNMEMPIAGWLPECCPVLNSAQEIKSANFPQIRLFQVEKNIDTKPAKDIKGGAWKEAVEEKVSDFSAVGYFFGRDLHQNLGVPIGLIGSYWGGSVIESWTSGEALKQGTDFEESVRAMEEINATPDQTKADIARKYEKWIGWINENDAGFESANFIWAKSDFNDSDWRKIQLPASWAKPGDPQLDRFNGAVWFRKDVNLEDIYYGRDLTIDFGRLAVSDEIFFNGEKIGGMRSNWSKRIYQVPSQLVKSGRNTITIRISESNSWGNILGDEGCVCIIGENGLADVSLAGDWKFKIGFRAQREGPPYEFGPNSKPTLLFNSMISPLTPYAIKGVIWYQGEGNAGRAYQYRSLFQTMIKDWRTQWNNHNNKLGDFPFLFVQLANLGKPEELPGEDSWAELREAQYLALTIPKTGMAVAIDVGQADNVHPMNKQAVAKRLALAGMKVAYQKDIVYSGPIYESMEINNNEIRIKFTSIGS